jgi:hypothetical protein
VYVIVEPGVSVRVLGRPHHPREFNPALAWLGVVVVHPHSKVGYVTDAYWDAGRAQVRFVCGNGSWLAENAVPELRRVADFLKTNHQRRGAGS